MKQLNKIDNNKNDILLFYDDYNLISGWIHDYFCDDDGSELIFDINSSLYYECPMCHKKYNDEKRKRAWITKYRYLIFTKIESYSKYYLKNKNKKYLNFIINALDYYCTNYDLFVIHNKNGDSFESYINTSNNCGKITAQGLNEASIFMQVVNCIDNVKEYIPQSLQNNIFNNLFPKVFNLLKPQVNKIHNIICYEVCSIGMMGIISRNKEMLDFALNSNYSFYEQLNKGVTDDYFWYEGSFHYHLYVLKPIIEFLYFAKKYNYLINSKYFDIAKNMLIQAYNICFSDCSLPSPNDGWPNLFLDKYISLYEKANIIFDGYFESFIGNIKNHVNKSKGINLIKTGFSNLKTDNLNIFIKYNDNNLSHAHPDKLNIEVKYKNNFITHDLSTSGYGSIISKDFYKMTYSHNTVVIDEKNQSLDCVCHVNRYTEKYIDVEIKQAYEDCTLKRTINVEDTKFTDNFYVKCNKNKKIDYFFHVDGELLSNLKYENEIEIVSYSYLSNVKKVKCNDTLTLNWAVNNILVDSTIDLGAKELYICTSPDNPNVKDRTTILIRDYSKECNFNLIWKFR